jgi:mannose-1-phosphate guanylyltransferase
MSNRHGEPSAESHADHSWALVLAAGDGTRLRQLTTTSCGLAVPKQFCSFGGGNSLLHKALERARVITKPERTCAIVAQQHRRWWVDLARTIPDHNIVVQPSNRGTANGILLPLLRILEREPGASLLVLPSDHYVRNESVLAGGLRQAMAQVKARHDRIVLLGFVPEQPDPELGYIVPAEESGHGARRVGQFVEKPSAVDAGALIESGALWNSFIFAANGQTLLQAFAQHCPEVVEQMRTVVEHGAEAELTELYNRLPSLDFSRDIVQRHVSKLLVIRVPPCRWSDLGTPRRVAEAVDRCEPASGDSPMPGSLDLAIQYAQLQAAQLSA